jgi:hypothetical protein
MTGDSDLAAFYEAIYERLVPIFPVEVPAPIGFRIGSPRPAIGGGVADQPADGRVTQLHGGQGCGL